MSCRGEGNRGSGRGRCGWSAAARRFGGSESVVACDREAGEWRQSDGEDAGWWPGEGERADGRQRLGSDVRTVVGGSEGEGFGGDGGGYGVETGEGLGA